jgi:uncharacterized NAD-dependent epimerase/dehydratase family protein
MSTTTTIELRAPYLIMIGNVKSPMYAKTGLGIVYWRRERVAGQLRFANCPVDLGVPDMSVEEAKDAGVGSLIIGVAPVGGVIPDSWQQMMEAAAAAGIDVVSGLHVRLRNYPALAAATAASGARLVDVRVPPANIPVGTGRKRRGKRVLMVGTDCAVGKKYSALALQAAMAEAGMHATFRATGQTGIMIAGQGMPIDAVVSDFVSGAAEILSPDNDDGHWDVIEGQGSLFHPGYAAVSLGLLHGSQPDAIVVCHEASRTRIDEWVGYQLPSINECIAMNLAAGRLTNKDIRCVGVSVNTSGLDAAERGPYLERLAAETGMPCTDPIANGMAPIVANIRKQFAG